MTDKRPVFLGLGNTLLGRMVTDQLGRAYTGTGGLFARLRSFRAGGSSGVGVVETAYSATIETSDTMHLHAVGWAPVRAFPDDASMGCCQPASSKLCCSDAMTQFKMHLSEFEDE